MAAGDTVGILVVAEVDGLQWEDSGATSFNDANLTIFSEIGSDGGDFSGINVSSRVFAGSVTYGVSVAPPVPTSIAVPTMTTYGLILTVLGLVFVVSRRLRR